MFYNLSRRIHSCYVTDISGLVNAYDDNTVDIFSKNHTNVLPSCYTIVLEHTAFRLVTNSVQNSTEIVIKNFKKRKL